MFFAFLVADLSDLVGAVFASEGPPEGTNELCEVGCFLHFWLLTCLM